MLMCRHLVNCHLLGMAVGLLAVSSASDGSDYVRLVYNASVSMPRGWYRVQRLPRGQSGAAALRIGDIVLAKLPASAAALAADRGYLPWGVPVLKRVAAMAPQHACVDADMLHIDGVGVAALRLRDAAGRRLHPAPLCRHLRAQEVLLLGDMEARSFDSRYFGPVDVSAVIGVAKPLRVAEAL